MPASVSLRSRSGRRKCGSRLVGWDRTSAIAVTQAVIGGDLGMHLDVHLRIKLHQPPRVSLCRAAAFHFNYAAGRKDERKLFHPFRFLQALVKLRQPVVLLHVVIGRPLDDQVRARAMNRLAVGRYRICNVPRVEARPTVAVGTARFRESGLDRLLRQIACIVFFRSVALLGPTGRSGSLAGKEGTAVGRLRSPSRAKAATALGYWNVVAVQDRRSRMLVAPARPR